MTNQESLLDKKEWAVISDDIVATDLPYVVAFEKAKELIKAGISGPVVVPNRVAKKLSGRYVIIPE